MEIDPVSSIVSTSNKKELPRVKIVVVGASGVGKTSLSNRFVMGDYNPRSPATLGATFLEKVLDLGAGRSYKLQIWDTAGQ